MKSWTLSRPLLAFFGVISAAMSISSSIGLLLLIGFQMTSMVYAIPIIIFGKFLILFNKFLAVGVDNIFILLSVWRSTSPKMNLNERMAKTYGDAAVSITITSLTDLISFAVGYLSPFPSVNVIV